MFSSRFNAILRFVYIIQFLWLWHTAVLIKPHSLTFYFVLKKPPSHRKPKIKYVDFQSDRIFFINLIQSQWHANILLWPENIFFCKIYILKLFIDIHFLITYRLICLKIDISWLPQIKCLKQVR